MVLPDVGGPSTHVQLEFRARHVLPEAEPPELSRVVPLPVGVYRLGLVPRLLTAHLRLVAAGFREQATYRLAAVAGLVANTTFGLLKVAVLFATVEVAGGELHGYDVA